MKEIIALRQRLDEAARDFEVSEHVFHMTSVEKDLLLRFLKAEGMVLLARWQGIPNEEIFKLRPLRAISSSTTI